jgi:protein ImuA
MTVVRTAGTFERLKSDILRLEGFKSQTSTSVDIALGPLKDAFPNRSFPIGAVHEFLSARPEDAAATGGFVSGILSSIMGKAGTSLWISSSRTLFPPALKTFGIQPDRFIFIDLKREREILWAIDEALKCSALVAVVGEVQDLSFTASRRLQLAVEESQVTGFILRNNLRKLTTTACVSRWKISSIASDSIDGLPGVGFPKWKVELMRIKNGKPGTWELEWKNGRFVPAYKLSPVVSDDKFRIGEFRTPHDQPLVSPAKAG